MSSKIVVTKISTMVDVFYVPDTPEKPASGRAWRV